MKHIITRKQKMEKENQTNSTLKNVEVNKKMNNVLINTVDSRGN